MEQDEVNLKTIRSIDLTTAKHQLITIPGVWLVAIFMAGWMGKPWLADAVGFVTKAEAEQTHKAQAEERENLGKRIEEISLKQAQETAALAQKFDDHIQEFRITNAFILERTLDSDYTRHTEENLGTPTWKEEQKKLKNRLDLAKQYKQCLIDGRSNCEIYQKQLYK